jgi:tRNA (mo5U34)-methyltransferase
MINHVSPRSEAQRMPPWRRLCRLLANEGLAGVRRRVVHTAASRWNSDPEAPLLARAKQEWEQRVLDFRAAALRLGYPHASKYYWYHTIDLGNGLLTPGDYDYRSALPYYHFPSDMRGMKVLDVGSATGFFAFEFEKRGATVVSVDLPSITDWDMPLGSDREHTIRELMGHAQVNTVEEVDEIYIKGPFRFCHDVLGSRVVRCHSRIYDLSLEKLGQEDPFDMIFVGDVLLHTFSPLAALVALAPLCNGLLIVAQQMADAAPDMPCMLYMGGEARTLDSRTWWHPNRLCLEQILKRVGFKDVTQVDQARTYPGRDWMVRNSSVIHARK